MPNPFSDHCQCYCDIAGARTRVGFHHRVELHGGVAARVRLASERSRFRCVGRGHDARRGDVRAANLPVEPLVAVRHARTRRWQPPTRTSPPDGPQRPRMSGIDIGTSTDDPEGAGPSPTISSLRARGPGAAAATPSRLQGPRRERRRVVERRSHAQKRRQRRSPSSAPPLPPLLHARPRSLRFRVRRCSFAGSPRGPRRRTLSRSRGRVDAPRRPGEDHRTTYFGGRAGEWILGCGWRSWGTWPRCWWPCR
jgi:hypothetical protein